MTPLPPVYVIHRRVTDKETYSSSRGVPFHLI
jgi:hypothetical protein